MNARTGLKPPQSRPSLFEAEEKTIRLANKHNVARGGEYSISVGKSPFHLSLPDDLVSSRVEATILPLRCSPKGRKNVPLSASVWAVFTMPAPV